MKIHRNKRKLLSIFMVLAISLTMLGINLSATAANDIQADFTSPTSRQVFGLGSMVEISGTAQGLAEVSITVRSEQDSLVFTAQPQVNDGIFTTSFTLDSNAAEGEYTISLSGLGLSEVKKRIILISDLKVVVDIVTPSADEEFDAGDVVEIAGTAENINYLAICVRNSDNGRVYVTQPTIENNSFTCGFTLSQDAAAGEYTIYITGYGMTAAQTSKFIVNSSGSPGGGGSGGGDSGDFLTINGNGVSNPVSYSLEDLQNMKQTRTVLSVTSDRPQDLDMAVEGVPLKTLLNQAGINWSKAKLIEFQATDTFDVEFTMYELFAQPRYIFPEKTRVEPIIALLRAEGSSDYDDMTDDDIPVLVYGQRAETDQTLLYFAKKLSVITVSTDDPDEWDCPTALIVTPDSKIKVATQGGPVPSGSLIYLKHSSAVPRIYYTTDGSTPDMDSDIFNLHGCGPEQGVEEPVEITGTTTIKALAIGRGQYNSDVMSLTFTVGANLPGGGGAPIPEPVSVPQVTPSSALTMLPISETNLRRELLSLDNSRTGEQIVVQEGALSDIENGVAGSRVTVISTANADEVRVQIPATVLQKAKEKGMPLGIDTLIGKYTLPLDTINLEEAAARLGVKLEELTLSIVISRASEEDRNDLMGQLQPGQQMLADPIQFTVEVTAPGGGKIEYSYFGGAYVERDLVLNKAANPRQAVGVVWNEAGGKFLPLPTLFETLDGKEYAAIFSRSNSLYTVLQSSKTFADIQNSWAKNDIELLSSKMLVNGKSANSFEPNCSITRAEFATLLVRALGLEEGVLQEGQFKDVDVNAWYAGAVATAVAENIITGYDGQLFKPTNNITREEIAVMIVRAARVAGIENNLSDAEQETYLARFGDQQSISPWAEKNVALAAKAGIINGMSNGDFSPRTNADRAQSAVMLKRFLEYINFIEVK